MVPLCATLIVVALLLTACSRRESGPDPDRAAADARREAVAAGSGSPVAGGEATRPTGTGSAAERAGGGSESTAVGDQAEAALARGCQLEPDAVQGEPGCRLPRDPAGWELIDRAAAMAWWPWRPILLGSGDLKYGKAQERIIASGGKRGRDCDPNVHPCRLLVSYGYPPNTLDKLSVYDFLDERGLFVLVESFPRTMQAPEPGGSRVTVRGRDAFYREMFRSKDANVDYRIIEWVEPQPDGTTLWWMVGTNDRSPRDGPEASG